MADREGELSFAVSRLAKWSVFVSFTIASHPIFQFESPRRPPLFFLFGLFNQTTPATG
jgi:hypothetical protein